VEVEGGKGLIEEIGISKFVEFERQFTIKE
jgi:hypothetical protein